MLGWLTTTDHKRIGLLYFFTALAFFGAGGIEALLIRTQLIGPNSHLLGPAAYDELFTMHGITMIFLFVIPMTTGAFGNYLIPLMIGARDMAFPRMNALSFWIYLALGDLHVRRAWRRATRPNAGWFDYVPLASKQFDPGNNIDFYGFGLIFNGIASIADRDQLHRHDLQAARAGHVLNRMPLFCFAFLAVAFALLFALPSLSVAALFLELDRQLGSTSRRRPRWKSAPVAEPVLDLRPPRGLHHHPAGVRDRHVDHSDVRAPADGAVPARRAGRDPGRLPRVRRLGAPHVHGRPATSTTVYFAAASLIIVIPSAIQLFAWITTILTGTPDFKTPMLFIVGFIVYFIVGGLSGITLAAIPFDQQVHDSYYVVAHFHFVIFGAAVFPILGGMYFWFPKVTGRMYHEGVGKLSFWLTFVGHVRDLLPDAHRRHPRHAAAQLHLPGRAGLGALNLIETIGAYILAVGLVLIVAQPAGQPVPGAAGGQRPVRRATRSSGRSARRRRLQLRRHPDGHKRLPDVGQRATASATTNAWRAARACWSTGTRRRRPRSRTPSSTRSWPCRPTRPGRPLRR